MIDHFTKLATKLYPRWWRERYGEEFAALLEDSRPGPAAILDVLKGALTMQLSSTTSWKPILACATVGLVAAVATTFLMTPQYSSSAVVSVKPSEGDTKGTGDIVDAIKASSNQVLSRSSLTNLIRNLNLYRDERNRMPSEDVLEEMKRNIRISAARVIIGGRTTAGFQISFQYPNKEVAPKVVNSLVSGFLDENLRADGGSRLTMQVLDPASTPANPIFRFAATGLGGGLLLGGLLAIVLHFRRRRQLPSNP